MRPVPLLALLLLASVPFFAQDGPSATPRAIEQVLEDQVAAWNRHDLEAFMLGYWHSSALTFFSGGESARGWQHALERYQKRYQSEGQEMGRLAFSELQIEPLGTDSAFVRGAFTLTMSQNKTYQGLFTLVFRKFPEGWKIIHDHTSAQP